MAVEAWEMETAAGGSVMAQLAMAATAMAAVTAAATAAEEG